MPSNEDHFELKILPEKRVVCVFSAPLTFWARFSLCRARRCRRRRPTRRTHRPRLTRRDKRERRRMGMGRRRKEGRKEGSAKLLQFSHFSSRYRDSPALPAHLSTLPSSGLHLAHIKLDRAHLPHLSIARSHVTLTIAIAAPSPFFCRHFAVAPIWLSPVPFAKFHIGGDNGGRNCLLRTRRVVNSIVFAGRAGTAKKGASLQSSVSPS